MEKPRFQHDCAACRFLGSYSFDGHLADGTTMPLSADLYVCRGDALGPSVIARFSDEGSDYGSLDVSVLKSSGLLTRDPSEMGTRTPGLLEAYRRCGGRY